MTHRFTEFVRSHQRWLIVALLFCVALVNNLDRQTLSVLAPTLQKELGFGPVEYSYIVSCFLAAYTVGYLFAGQVLDRIGVKVGLALALAFWSLAGLMHASATGWIMLAAFRFLLGLGESFNSPAGVKAISEWVPPSERGLSMAVFSNGNIVGAIIAPPLVAFLALHFGWRWAFVVTGLSGFALLIIWWRRYHQPEQHPHLTDAERTYISTSLVKVAAPGPRLSMWALLCNPLCLGFFVARFLTDSWSYFLSFWLPEYLTHSRGFTLSTIGLVGWLPYLAADLGGPGGGALSDWLVRRGWQPGRARRRLMLCAACLMPLALVAVRTEYVWLAIALIGLLFAAPNLLDGESTHPDLRKHLPAKRRDLTFAVCARRQRGWNRFEFAHGSRRRICRICSGIHGFRWPPSPRLRHIGSHPPVGQNEKIASRRHSLKSSFSRNATERPPRNISPKRHPEDGER